MVIAVESAALIYTCGSTHAISFRCVDSDGVAHPLHFMCPIFGVATPSAFAFKTVKQQINAVIGAFIARCGYVAAFTTCEAGQTEAKMK